MAHEIEQMAYRGAVPWHGLGNTIEESDTLEQIQHKAGLNWEVSKRPVIYLDDDGLGRKTFKDRFVLARTTDDRPYAVVSGRYNVVQPKEILQFFKELIERYNMRIETAGALRDGARIWALATTGDVYKIAGVDEIKGYLNIATSYDLSFSSVAYFTSVRVVCNNTLQQSFGDMHNVIKIPHFREFSIDDVHNQLGLGRDNWAAFTQMCEALNKVKVDDTKTREILNAAYRIPADPEKALLDSNRIHVQNVYDMFTGQRYIGADLATNSAWGLLNAQTEYVDHVKRARSRSNRLDSAWFGDGYQLKQRTVDELVKLTA